jgi:hypothetical protein
MVPDEEPRDLVDEYLRPFVRPLGNIVILYANAEAALRDFVLQMLPQHDEEEAHKIVSDKEHWQAKTAQLIEYCGLDQSIDELRAALKDYAEAREKRNRLAHDEWLFSIDLDNPKNASVVIRGLKGRRVVELMHREPTVDQLWQLARRFARAREVFDNAAYNLKRRSQEGRV